MRYMILILGHKMQRLLSLHLPSNGVAQLASDGIEVLNLLLS